jgi:hypothetical protein
LKFQVVVSPLWLSGLLSAGIQVSGVDVSYRKAGAGAPASPALQSIRRWPS